MARCYRSIRLVNRRRKADPDKNWAIRNSMGAGTSAIAFSMDDRIQAVWLDSGYADMGDIVVEELEFQGFPTFLGAGIFAGKIIAGQFGRILPVGYSYRNW